MFFYHSDRVKDHKHIYCLNYSLSCNQISKKLVFLNLFFAKDFTRSFPGSWSRFFSGIPEAEPLFIWLQKPLKIIFFFMCIFLYFVNLTVTFPTVIYTEGKYWNQLKKFRKFRDGLSSGSHETGSTAKKVTASDSAKPGPHIHIFFLFM